ncbi:MAG: aminotransferase class IV [Lachnospiraceae bacterium]|nr:aminotransferase class IV [Lachnospiraceae bacterium]MCR4731876.1 aminotransferase class IV [Lachnospiraceae bacterium]
MKTLGYYNGEIGELEDLKIPFNDRVCFFGDGVYDAAPARNYKIFAIKEHIDRFFNSAALMDIQIPMSKKELEDLLTSLVKKLDTGDQFVYWQVTRGTGIRNHAYDPLPGNMWVMLKPAGITDGLTPIKCVTAEDKRFLYCNVKTLNLLPSVLYAEKAYKADADETILYRHGGRVTECAHSNCHMIKNGIVYTAPTDDKILPGIARAHLVRMCKKLGIGISETPFDIDEMREADEILVTSSSNVCLRVNELDGKPVGGKDPETFERLRSALYKEICDATCED